MSKKETKNEAPKNNDYYQPILEDITWTKLPIPRIYYYELRIWQKHEITIQKQFNTLKQARTYYKINKLNKLEEMNKCYVEITKINNLNLRYSKYK